MDVLFSTYADGNTSVSVYPSGLVATDHTIAFLFHDSPPSEFSHIPLMTHRIFIRDFDPDDWVGSPIRSAYFSAGH